ncbi:addiction module antitoxin RelB [Halarcobacter ebronensis]|uniref:Addiction module antitoxin RelB n=1 Tax=Halarcobacter ebronensis TaxID=1462615 RepID=A0A4Q0YF29_9BACT|nr:addiction module protein [Halarcobacter ebronensis]RXJ69176.1 addiction module antitoxin RelB [Halarcobacter ebronensis]
MGLDDILKQIENLDTSEKYIILDRLLSELYPIDKDIEQEWIKLSEKRYKEFVSGNLQTISWEKIKSQL